MIPLKSGRPCGAAFCFFGLAGSGRRYFSEWSINLSSAIVPVYARADIAFERGDGCWLTAAMASDISILAAASQSPRSAIRILISLRR